mmetsp:Transcript_18980/g.18120  ORF Transcript_18980/g.18120 Transcript_18980/m.18120 type:complete len:95 (+) Transcript_18980:12-296(+)
MKLYYSDFYARAEVIRMVLSHAKLEYEDIRIDRDELSRLQKEGKKLEFGKIPILEIGGEMYSETQSILRFLGKQYGYYPVDLDAAWKVDSIIEA